MLVKVPGHSAASCATKLAARPITTQLGLASTIIRRRVPARKKKTWLFAGSVDGHDVDLVQLGGRFHLSDEAYNSPERQPQVVRQHV